MAGQGRKPNGKYGAKGRTGISMNVLIYRTTLVKTGSVYNAVDWTCPKCGHRNLRKRWYGREKHICEHCEEWTDVKGQTIDTHSINADIEIL